MVAPAVTVDVVILTVMDADLKVLLVRRGQEPFEGRWAIPGGFVRVGEGKDQGEDLDAAAARELFEETGLPPGAVFLEQVRAFGRPGRDPRGRVVTIAFAALVPPDRAALVRPGTDAADARWFSLTERPPLAFDHDEILDAAVASVRERLERTSVAFELVPETFTVQELRAVHEAVLGVATDPANFRRRFKRLLEDGVLEPAPGRRLTRTRPAAVYRFRRQAAR